MTWSIGCGTAQGSQHVENNIPCQDCCLVEEITTEANDTYAVFAVSDGAGHLRFRHTERGALFVCKYLIKRIRQRFRQGAQLADFSEDELSKYLFDLYSVIDRLCARASNDLVPEDFSATGMFGIVGSGQAVFMQVGDGGIIYRIAGQNEFTVCMSPADHKGELYNQTYMATQKNAYRNAIYTSLDANISEVCAFSDGLISFFMNIDDGIANTAYLDEFFNWLREEQFTDAEISTVVANTLIDEETLAKVSTDDKSLVMIYSNAPSGVHG